MTKPIGLLPCKCGGSGVLIITERVEYPHISVWEITCTNPDCYFTVNHRSKVKAIKAWNTRVTK